LNALIIKELQHR